MYEGLLIEVENVIKNYQELYKAIPHICSCCVGCTCERVDNSGCEYNFVPSADKIEKLIKDAHKKNNDILVPFNDCERQIGYLYWYINSIGEIESKVDRTEDIGEIHYNVGNYCRDKKKIKQRALHEILNRLLWQFSEINGSDNIWDKNELHWFITYDIEDKQFNVVNNRNFKQNNIYFYSKEIAEKAIEEVIKPFVTKHPEFEW